MEPGSDRNRRSSAEKAAHADACELILAGKEWLGKMTELLNNRLTLAQHRHILSAAGMLALLVGCLEYDLGDQRMAEATRRKCRVQNLARGADLGR